MIIRNNKLMILLFSIVLFSCNTTTKDLNKSHVLKKTNEKNEISNKQSLTETILIENKIKHAFSNPDKLDLFQVYLKGESILKSKLVFVITNYNGVVLLKEEYSSIDLIGYGLDNNASNKVQEEFIKKRIAEFFKEDNFSKPAIKLDTEFVSNYSEKQVWDDIKSDQTAIGFDYLIGEEDGRSIAYSKKFKKVVEFYGCC